MFFAGKNRKYIVIALILAFAVNLAGKPLFVQAEEKGSPDAIVSSPTPNRAQHVDDGSVVIVIDPGHGGGNLGTQSGDTIEKEMTMITAKSMYAELEKYDNVKVYLTHSDDRDMSLKERAEFAASVGADFLFSLHYNASENHTMFGSEVWISCETPYNAYGYQFGYEHLQSMAEKGLFIRGVKNRKNDEGTDYYGIIRESVALSVPAVIIEHCYVDEERDHDYVANADCWTQFGKDDALSAAKYFGLKSASLGVDYSNEAAKLQPVVADAVIQRTLQDLTKPDVCEIELIDCDYETGKISVSVSAADYDNNLIYYDYSIDNGKNWSRLESWPGCNMLTGEYVDTFVLNLKIPDGVKPNIQLRAYNMTDLFRTSNTLTFDQAFAGAPSDAEDMPLAVWESESAETQEDTSDEQTTQESENTPVTEPVEHTHKSVGTTTFQPADSEAVEEGNEVGVLTFLKISLIIAILIFTIVLISQMVNYFSRKKRRRSDKRN